MSEPVLVREAVVFRGRVQGVGFRVTAQQVAEPLGLSGWVRNEPDGSVAAQVQGSRSMVEVFFAELGEAMSGNIDSVERRTLPPDRELGRFRVERGPHRR